MVAGSGIVGTWVASADLFGIGGDILDILGHHKDKKKKNDHGASVRAQNSGGNKKSDGPGQRGPKSP